MPSRAGVMNHPEKGVLAPLAVYHPRTCTRSKSMVKRGRGSPNYHGDPLKNHPLHMENVALIGRGKERCSRCQLIRPLADFPNNSPALRKCIGGVGTMCHECYAIFNRDRMMKYNYGVTMEEYQSLFTAQHFSCAICGTPGKSPDTMVRSGKGGSANGVLHVDHDHITGKVRGLLCSACNHGVGNFKDDLSLLERAIKYLQHHTTQCDDISYG